MYRILNTCCCPACTRRSSFTDRAVEPPLLVPGDSIMATPNGLEVAILIDPTPQQRQKIQEEEERQKKQARTEGSGQKGSDQKGSDQKGSDQKDTASQRPPASQAKRVHIQKIEVGRDYGLETEVTYGLEGWEYVVTNPGDQVEEGALVIPQKAPDIAGEGGSQRRGPSDKHPSGIGAPSMAAPTQGAPQQGGGQGGGQSGGQSGSKGGGH